MGCFKNTYSNADYKTPKWGRYLKKKKNLVKTLSGIFMLTLMVQSDQAIFSQLSTSVMLKVIHGDKDYRTKLAITKKKKIFQSSVIRNFLKAFITNEKMHLLQL